MSQAVMPTNQGLRGSVQLQNREYPFEQWSGQRCSSQLIAIDTETTVVESRGQVPRLAVVQVFDGENVFLIKPKDVSAWLNLHRDCSFVAHNVQFDWHVVYRHFRRERDRVSMKRWLATVDEDRFTDTMLLDQLCRIAAGSRHHAPRNLADVAKQYCGIAIDKQDPYRTRFGETIGRPWESFPVGMWYYAAKDPIVTSVS